MDAQREVDQQRVVTVSPPVHGPRLRPELIVLSLLVVALVASPFLMALAGWSFGPNQPYDGPHANLVAGDYLVWDRAIAYTSDSVMHLTLVWNITGSNDRTFTMHHYGSYPNGTIEYNNESRLYSYWPRIGVAFCDSNNNNATPTIETIQTAFGEKRVYHYHCPERSLGDGAYIPSSDSYIGVDTNVVYKTMSYSPGSDATFTLKDTNAQSVLNGDRP